MFAAEISLVDPAEAATQTASTKAMTGKLGVGSSIGVGGKNTTSASVGASADVGIGIGGIEGVDGMSKDDSSIRHDERNGGVGNEGNGGTSVQALVQEIESR